MNTELISLTDNLNDLKADIKSMRADMGKFASDPECKEEITIFYTIFDNIEKIISSKTEAKQLTQSETISVAAHLNFLETLMESPFGDDEDEDEDEYEDDEDDFDDEDEEEDEE